jgi:4a-hydroxytetrahydrobiopterin dehydratase
LKQWLEGHSRWSIRKDRLFARVPFPDFQAALQVIQTVGAFAEAADRHPDLHFGYGSASVELFTHDVGRVTQKDLDLAEQIDTLADSNP